MAKPEEKVKDPYKIMKELLAAAGAPTTESKPEEKKPAPKK